MIATIALLAFATIGIVYCLAVVVEQMRDLRATRRTAALHRRMEAERPAREARYGVTFTDRQMRKIRRMYDRGDKLGAQRYILRVIDGRR